MNLLILITILFPLQLTAQGIDLGVIRALEEMNHPTNCDPSCETLKIGTDESHNVIQNDCAKAICGSPSANKIGVITDKNFNQYTTADNQKKVVAVSRTVASVIDKLNRDKENEIRKIINALKKRKDERFINALHDRVDELASPDYQNKEIMQCLSYLLTSTSNMGNIIDAKKRFDEAKEAVLKNVMPLFSEHSRKMINDTLAKTKLNTLLPDQDKPDKLLENFVRDSRYYVSQFTSNEPPVFSSEDQISMNEIEEIISKVERTNPCKLAKTNLIQDFYQKSDETIYISNFSCAHDLRGKQIIAHEIGHVISDVMKDQAISKESIATYLKERTCVARRYKNAPKPIKQKFTPDNFFTEEDMADRIAHMAFNKSPEIYACSLLTPEIISENYTDLSVMVKSADRHSTDLYRVLIESIQKGREMPLSCKKLIEKESFQIGFNKCE